jgi:phosphoenolpyruvate-protein phosphotransferase (PTS system enzyme I)
MEEARQASSMGVKGIGLFRTELSFLNGDIGLTVDDQFEAYSNILKLFPKRPVTLRTLDLSGDKQEYINLISKETLAAGRSRSFIKKTCNAQMKALIKASKYGELTIAFPMVSKAEEMASLKEQILSIQKKLSGTDPKNTSPVSLGAFIETPAGVYALEDILDHTDTISIGTNDLLVLVYGGSRQSSRPQRSDDLLHPITIRLLYQIIEHCHKKNQKVSVCGGIATNPKFLPILVGVRADGISVELKRYREVLDHTNKLNPAKCIKLVLDLRKMKTKKEIIDALCSFGADRIR